MVNHFRHKGGGGVGGSGSIIGNWNGNRDRKINEKKKGEEKKRIHPTNHTPDRQSTKPVCFVPFLSHPSEELEKLGFSTLQLDLSAFLLRVFFGRGVPIPKYLTYQPTSQSTVPPSPPALLLLLLLLLPLLFIDKKNFGCTDQDLDDPVFHTVPV